MSLTLPATHYSFTLLEILALNRKLLANTIVAFNVLAFDPNIAMLTTELVILTFLQVIFSVFLEDAMSTSVRWTADLLHGTIIHVVWIPGPPR